MTTRIDDPLLMRRGGKTPRTCQRCGNYLDPIDYCAGCAAGEPCVWHGKAIRRHGNRRYCSSICRAKFWRGRRRERSSARRGICRRTLTLPGL
jgi:hypothetical protein